MYRNGAKAGVIPQDKGIQATKVSGLAVDTEYVFHLVLRTSAGIYSSERLTVKTHKMTELSGITVTPGVLPPSLRESLGGALDRIGAKIADSVRIDTTHFVCTEGRGDQWQKACEMNIPIVRPEWVEGCEREGRIVGVRGYYLDANPKLRQVGQGVGMQQQQQQQQSPRQPQIQRTDSNQTIPYRQQQQQSQQPASQSPIPKLPPPTPHSPQHSPTESSEAAPPLPEKDTPAPPPQERVSAEDSSEDGRQKSDGGGGDISPLSSPVKVSTKGAEEAVGEREEEGGDDARSFSTVAL